MMALIVMTRVRIGRRRFVIESQFLSVMLLALMVLISSL